MLQPQIAAQLKARKLATIARTKPFAVAAGNIGCMTQLASGAGVPVVHTVEFVDWANGGPLPEPLAQSASIEQPELRAAAHERRQVYGEGSEKEIGEKGSDKGCLQKGRPKEREEGCEKGVQEKGVQESSRQKASAQGGQKSGSEKSPCEKSSG